jgi:putative transposase
MDNNEINKEFLVPDQLWEQIEPLLPPEPPKPKGGRPMMDNRKAMDAIFYVLRTGCQWKALPGSLGAPSTVHDRFQKWVKDGVFQEMWKAGLLKCEELKKLDWEWQAMDGVMTKAPLGGEKNRTKSDRPWQEWNQT